MREEYEAWFIGNFGFPPMQAENLDRQMQGYSLAYSEAAFFQEAGTLEQIAVEVINQ